jgi:hypothetical protein
MLRSSKPPPSLCAQPARNRRGRAANRTPKPQNRKPQAASRKPKQKRSHSATNTRVKTPRPAHENPISDLSAKAYE